MKSSSSTTAAPTRRRRSSTSWRAPIRTYAWCIIRRTAATAARCRPAFARRPRISSSTPTATRSTTPPSSPMLWAKMTADADLVNGYKISRSDPLHRIVIGRVYHHIVSLLFGLRVRDVDCDFRLMRRSIFEKIDLEKTSGVICLEMMKKIQRREFPHRRSAGAPLSPRLRQVAVLQLPPDRQDRRRRAASLVRAGHPPPPLAARRAAAGQERAAVVTST